MATAWMDSVVLVYNEARACKFAQAGNRIALYDLHQAGAGEILIGGAGACFNGGAKMKEPLREIEGTWEEIMTHEAELYGHQVKLTVLDMNNTPQTNTDGTILPRGSYGRILQGLHLADLESGINKSNFESEEGDLWDVISAQRAVWRKLAQEKSE